HHPDAGEESADRRRRTARSIPRLRARCVDGQSASLPLAGRPQGHEDRRDCARLEHAFHGAASDGDAWAQARRRLLRRRLPMYSRDGRFANDAAETAYGVLKAFDPDVGSAKIDISATYTNAFVGKVPAQP